MGGRSLGCLVKVIKIDSGRSVRSDGWMPSSDIDHDSVDGVMDGCHVLILTMDQYIRIHWWMPSSDFDHGPVLYWVAKILLPT
eukprot:gene20228-biopygen14617